MNQPRGTVSGSPGSPAAPSAPASGGGGGGGSGGPQGGPGLPGPSAPSSGGQSPFSGVFAALGGLYRSPLFQQTGLQPTFGVQPGRRVSSTVSVAQPGSVPGSPFEQLLRMLHQAQQGVM